MVVFYLAVMMTGTQLTQTYTEEVFDNPVACYQKIKNTNAEMAFSQQDQHDQSKIEHLECIKVNGVMLKFRDLTEQ